MDWKDILWELVQMIENAAPHTWAIALRQVMVMAYKAGMWAGVGLLLATVGGWIGIRNAVRCSKSKYDDPSGWQILATCSIIGGGAIALSSLTGLIGYVGNPEYYAIEELVGLATTLLK